MVAIGNLLVDQISMPPGQRQGVAVYWLIADGSLRLMADS